MSENNENQAVETVNDSGAASVNQPLNEQDLLVQLAKKQLFFQKITACFVGGMFAVVLIAAVIMIPKVSITLNHVNTVAKKAETSLENMDELTASLQTTSENLNTLVSDNAEGLANAVKSISEIDIKGLNQAISDLQTTIGPMASFFGKFR